jgi:hypothetical protein
MHGWVAAGITTTAACTPASCAGVSSASDSVTKIPLPLSVHQRVSDSLNLKLVEACATCSFATIAKPTGADADLVEVRDVLLHSPVGLELRIPLALLWFVPSNPPPALLQ